MQSMNMPIRLNELGIKESDIDHIAQVGLTAGIIQLTCNNESRNGKQSGQFCNAWQKEGVKHGE